MSSDGSPYDSYRSPLEGRYASEEMKRLWSDRYRFGLWRKIWLAVAESQHEMGLPVTKEQVAELRANLDVTDEDLRNAAEYESKLRHDVMAHVHAWGDRCPKARGIIHLGMTSQDVNDNAELIQICAAIDLIREKSLRVVCALGGFAARWKSVPTLGFTHFQPAQPTTVGRRAVQWAHDLEVGAVRIRMTRSQFMRLRGLRGATGTQASFLSLTNGDASRVRDVERAFVKRIGQDVKLEQTYGLVAQTYARVIDSFAISDLGAIASVLHKIATDIRLLCNRKELDEPFESSQIGSSAMPYKRNPMRCERVCGLSRFVWNLVGNVYDTAATQWLERTLDDSANRRLVLPEAFLALDACLDIMHNVVSGLVVHEATVRKNLMAELPFLATENVMMEAVKLGRDRQEVHEAIRKHGQEAGTRVKSEGAENDLIARLKKEPLLKGVNLDDLMDPMKYVGLAVEQTEWFLKEVVEPLRGSVGAQAAPVRDLKV